METEDTGLARLIVSLRDIALIWDGKDDTYIVGTDEVSRLAYGALIAVLDYVRATHTLPVLRPPGES